MELILGWGICRVLLTTSVCREALYESPYKCPSVKKGIFGGFPSRSFVRDYKS